MPLTAPIGKPALVKPLLLDAYLNKLHTLCSTAYSALLQRPAINHVHAGVVIFLGIYLPTAVPHVLPAAVALRLRATQHAARGLVAEEVTRTSSTGVRGGRELDRQAGGGHRSEKEEGTAYKNRASPAVREYPVSAMPLFVQSRHAIPTHNVLCQTQDPKAKRLQATQTTETPFNPSTTAACPDITRNPAASLQQVHLRHTRPLQETKKQYGGVRGGLQNTSVYYCLPARTEFPPKNRQTERACFAWCASIIWPPSWPWASSVVHIQRQFHSKHKTRDNTYGGGLLHLGLNLLHSSLGLYQGRVSDFHESKNKDLDTSAWHASVSRTSIRVTEGVTRKQGWVGATCLFCRARLLGLGDSNGLGAGGLGGGLGLGLAGDSRSSVGCVKNARLGVAGRRARALSCHYARWVGLELWGVETRQ